MSDTRVDFKSIKSLVSMEMVLARYEVNWLRKKEDELRGRCPIHQGEGKDTFHVNVLKNVFNCFSCKKRGNILDFVAAMEKCSVRDAGVKIKEWFSEGGHEMKQGSVAQQKSVTKTAEEKVLPLVNKPLTFELRGVDPRHGYLEERGVSVETAEEFGVGYFSGKGSMSGRVVIPIHNERGELVAYSGRAIDGSDPKYKLPAGFHKSVELYNLHRVPKESKHVVVVEGFFDCMKVWASGCQSVCALMGSALSEAQEELIGSRFDQVVLMLDGDGAGRTAAVEIAGRLVKRMFVRMLNLPDGQQPDSMTEKDLKLWLMSWLK